MYCGNCGAQNPDGAVHCGNCGAALNPAPTVDAATSKKHRTIGIAAIAGAVAVVAVIVLLIVLLSGGGNSGPKAAARDFVETMLSGKMNKLADMIPDELLTGVAKEQGLTKSEARDQLAKGLDQLSGIGGILQLVEFKIGEADVESMDRDDLKRVKDAYSKYDVKVKDGKTVELELTMEYLGEKQTETMDVPTVKIGGDWYVDFLNLDDMF